jgi:hypothetical protein
VVVLEKKTIFEDYVDSIKKLEPVFYICDKCGGRGATLTALGRFGKAYEPCKKCNCEGKINWAKRVFVKG